MNNTGSTTRDEMAGAPDVDGAATRRRPARRSMYVEAAFAAAVFTALCIAVLSVSPKSAEPDDGAYHASISGIASGHLLTLSTDQAETLAGRLGDNPDAPPNQWVQLADGRYISEKDPGYPFLAAPFYSLGIIRWAPLFYGALACLGLFVGARRWLGQYGGLAAVGLYCSSGAALAFAWRDYMPTFTDASLIAAGLGTLLWAVLATEASARRRTLIGLAGFVAIELATFVRYTDIVVLGCAVVTVIIVWRRPATRLSNRMVSSWLASAAAFGVGLAIFNHLVYGGFLRSGYRPGEVTFGLSAAWPNLQIMPRHLIQAMPMLVLGVVSLGWILIRAVLLRSAGGELGSGARRDLAVATATAATWIGVWGLYLTYTWTTDPTNVSVQDVRFYVPALGAISLLGAWPITRIPAPRWQAGAWVMPCLAAIFALGVWAFHAMYAAFGIPLNG